VYDATGRKIGEPVKAYQQPGLYSVPLNMQDLPSGIYFYRIDMGGFREVKKMIKLQ